MRFDRDAVRRLVSSGWTQAVFSSSTALESVAHNKLRAALTSLGILFGVASVIAMLAIGKGAEMEILEQMRLLGSNNVMVTPLVEQTEEPVTDEPKHEVKKFSPGLTREDAAAITDVIPAAEVASAETVLDTHITRSGLRRSAKVVGVDTAYFRLTNRQLAAGSWFAPLQVSRDMAVCIIGSGVRTRFFTAEDPVGKVLKVGDLWLTVVGVLADQRFSQKTASLLGIRDANMDVYVPIGSMLLRYRDRARLTERDIELAARPYTVTMNNEEQETPEQQRERSNRNQLDRIIVHVADSRSVPAVADVMRRLLTRRHNEVVDFEITIPELLLKQEQRTRTIFDVVLGAIASISLIVGGIGIMNIMLASVLERIREIGVRRAVGARQREILLQFLTEAVLISVVGGVSGIILGAALSSAIQRFAGIATVVSYSSVVLAFGVSFTVGLVFGIVPAYRAAQQDPVICLRHE